MSNNSRPTLVHTALLLSGLFSACAEPPPASSAAQGSNLAPATQGATYTNVSNGASPPVATHTNVPPDPNNPAGELDLAQARTYMVALINRDRAAAGLAPVEEERGPARAAGVRHATDMARVGFVGHWGSDGSVPEQRQTEAGAALGGSDVIMENAFCYEVGHALVQNARFRKADLEKAQGVFMAERPPADGHKRNILNARHTHVGIGLAMPSAGPNEILSGPCLTQEFLDRATTWAVPPPSIKLGQTVYIDVTLAQGVVPGGVGVVRLPPQVALGQAELNRRRSYPIPAPTHSYWTAQYQTPKPVTVVGQRMTISLPPSEFASPGLYEVSIWGRYPGESTWAMLAQRTVVVSP